MRNDRPIKKKTLKLKVEKQANFRIIGISSHENDYRLVWAINDHLKMQFTRIENLVVDRPKVNDNQEFSRYLFHDEDRYFKLFMVANRCPDGILFPEVKNIDFIIQVIGEINDSELKELVKKIKSVPVVSAAFVLETGKLKDVDKILSEE